MRNVYKFQFEAPHLAIVTRLPAVATVVHVGEQEGKITVWIEFPMVAPCVNRRFIVAGTGDPVFDDLLHVGTVQMSNGLVWHVYQSPAE